jgi:hypothetical protein
MEEKTQGFAEERIQPLFRSHGDFQFCQPNFHVSLDQVTDFPEFG